MFSTRLKILIITVAIGVFSAASAQAATVFCPKDNGAGVGCGALFYCNSSCQSMPLQYCPSHDSNPVSPCSTIDACGACTACTGGHVLCGNYPTRDCATLTPPPGISNCTQGDCSGYCTSCGSGGPGGYQLCTTPPTSCTLISVASHCQTLTAPGCTAGSCATCVSGYLICSTNNTCVINDSATYHCASLVTPSCTPNVCGSCVGGYTLCGTQCKISTGACNPGQSWDPCTATCTGFSGVKIGGDSLSGTTIIQSPGYPLFYIPYSTTGSNIGIGTSSPGSLLHLYKNNNVNNAEIALQSGNSTTVQSKWSIYNAGIGTSDGSLRFWNTNAGDALTILKTGNVGIGTTAPSTDLAVRDTNYGISVLPAAGSDTVYNTLYISNNSANRIIGSNIETKVGTWTIPNNTYASSWIDFSGSSPNYLGDIFFNTRAAGDVTIGSAKMVILNAGNVGIGTSDPGNLLHLYKNNNVNNAEIALQSGNSTTVQSKWSIYNAGIGTSDGSLRFWNISAGDALTILKTGNVGIGTTVPGSALQISNSKGFNIYIDHGSSGETRYYQLGSIGGNNGVLKVNGTLAGHTQGQGRGSVDMAFSGREGFKALGNAYGAFSAADLVVYFDSPNNIYNVYLKTITWALVNIDLTAVSGAGVTYNGSYTTTAPSGTLTYTLSSNVGSTIRMDNAGNVGIGTMGPLTPLDVRNGYGYADTGQRMLAFFGSNDTTGPLGLALFNSNEGSRLHTALVGTRYGLSGTDIDINRDFGSTTGGMTVQYGANVGIGTTNPGYRLSVVDTGTVPVINIWNNSTTKQWTGTRLARGGTADGAEKWFIGLNATDDNLRFRRTATTDDIVIDTTGKVTINSLAGTGGLVGVNSSGTLSLTSGSMAVYAGSTASHNGLFTNGYSDANAFCSGTTGLSGSHVCTTGEILNTINSGQANLIPANSTLWISNGPPAFTANANDCQGWTTAAHNSYGAIWNKIGINGFGTLNPCDFPYPFACCK